MVAYAVDIEPTNRCNADCHFCPRDMTPHQGLMSLATFEQALARVVEYREAEIAVAGEAAFQQISLCGEGEPLLNRNLPDFVRMVREAGFTPHVASNGSLLDERRGDALIEAGLERIALNIGEIGDDYERVYKLPWAKTRDNVLRFVERAAGRCEVVIVLVDHRRDPGHARKMRRWWTKRGVTSFMPYSLMNRGGSLDLEDMRYDTMPARDEAEELYRSLADPPQCAVPLFQLFVGYDGQYYLCCSDWQKQVPLGSVFDRSFVDIMRQKIEAVTWRDRVCHSCSADPQNMLTAKLQQVRDGAADRADVDQLIDQMRFRWAIGRHAAEQYDTTLAGWSPGPRPRARTLIPVRQA